MEFDVIRALEFVSLPKDTDQDTVRQLLTNDQWVVQEKYDGIRRVIWKTDDEITVRNRRGQLTSLHPRIVRALQGALINGSVIDCEKLHNGEIVIFDVLCYGGLDLRDLPYNQRRLAFKPLSSLATVRPAETAITTETKIALVEKMLTERREGIVLKNDLAPHRVGKTGDVLRFKFTHRLDAVIQRALEARPRGFSMYLHNPKTDSPQYIGRVAGARWFDMVEPGSTHIAEIEYLYASADYHLINPRIIRFRDDKTHLECPISQLTVGNRYQGNKAE